MKAVVVGYGSIGARHARVLEHLGLSVSVVSRHAGAREHVYADVATALERHRPEYIVIANSTVDHAATIDTLATLGYTGLLLVEKPVVATTRRLPASGFRAAFVGYNLRFHPVMQALREALGARAVTSVHAYVGQYLPDWRPQADYRQSYSASRSRGGGVLRDLSHELDYVEWLFGPWSRLTALGGRYGRLEIDTDTEDCYSVLFSMKRAPLVNVSMNYLDTVHQRTLTVNLEGNTLVADLMANSLRSSAHTRKFELHRDHTYELEHRAVLEGHHETLCSLDDGMAVVETIDAIERASATGSWVTR